MRLRPEIALNALIALVIGVNILVLFLIYEDRVSNADATASVVAFETPATTIVSTDVTPPSTGAVEPSPGGSETTGGLASVAAPINAQESLRSALVGVQVQFLQAGVMPATAFELKGSVPGLKLVDGVELSDQSTIGVVTTETTALLVTQGQDGMWYCVASDGTAKVTYFDQGASLDEVGTFSACNASTDGWR